MRGLLASSYSGNYREKESHATRSRIDKPTMGGGQIGIAGEARNWAAAKGARRVVKRTPETPEGRLRHLLHRARELARSGRHQNFGTIDAELRDAEDYPHARHWFEDERFRTQLNKLCARATRPPEKRNEQSVEEMGGYGN
jgi:hypothetical protein